MHTAETQAADATYTPGTPAVSVVVPAYRVAAYIGATLRSIFAQTFGDFEVIVINDGSPDTPELDQALAPFRDQIIYVRQENAGPSGARNTGIARARGRYIAFLDGDDEWFPTFLEKQVRLLESDPSSALVYSDAETFGDHPHAGTTSIDSFPSIEEATFERLLRIECVVQTSGTIACREALVAAGLFDTQFSYAEDFDLWLRVAHSGRVRHNRSVLARHRLHRASLSADETRMYEGRIAVYRKIRETLPLTAEQHAIVEDEIRRCTARVHTEAGKRLLLANDYVGARTELRRAVELLPSRKVRFVLLAARIFPAGLRALYAARDRAAARGVLKPTSSSSRDTDLSEARGNA